MRICVTVAYSPGPREVCELALDLPEGSTVEQALQASGLLQRFPELDPAQQGVGVWGRKAGLGQVLRDQDRVEIYRLLKVDPKLARRERFQKQGARATGLFAKRRPGAKPGY
ncbi:RnfH family protein [Ramlibacter sp. 2FC]|uniref:RnfH family protein n=1 Tax=Ramlibacter sp. 2FC TaxID=2502188 RepID=UPI0010FA20F4|nr:RnfH family protein [Ramlibacter sp. 2FC]